MDKQALTRIFDYHYWANRRLWYSVVALNDEQFTQILSDSSPSIRTQLVHMVSNENLWVNYLWHGEVEFLQECHLPTRASIRQEWDALEEEMRDFISTLSHIELERQVQPPFLNTGVSLKLWESLLQITHQATTSRAQLRLHLNRLGSPSLSHDFIDFVAVHRNAAPWWKSVGNINIVAL
jgi:uncharacterized damage-inducible protein DinB